MWGIKVGLYCFNMEEFVMIKCALLAYSFNLFTVHDNVVVTNAETVLSHREVLIVLKCHFNSFFSVNNTTTISLSNDEEKKPIV